jgi:hypothetical protein
VDHQVVDIHRLAVAPCLLGHLAIVSSAVGSAPGGPPDDLTRLSDAESNLEKSATDALSLIETADPAAREPCHHGLVTASLFAWRDRAIDLLLVASCGCTGTRCEHLS